MVQLRLRLAERQMDLELTEDARSHLVRVGYAPNYGARPLKRAIQREVENPLARLIVSGELREGTYLLVDYEAAKQELVFSQGPLAAANAGAE